MDLALILLAACFVWITWLAIRHPSRKNFYGMVAVACILGLVVGFEIAWRWYIPELRGDIRKALIGLEDEQFYATTLSFAALKKLEAGKEAETKLFLADQVAYYYRRLKNAKTRSPQQQKMLSLIDEAGGNSQILKQKLAEQH